MNLSSYSPVMFELCLFIFTDDSNKKRFESMQSMLEAKCAMNYLFEMATKHQVSLATQEADMKDLQVMDL